MLGNGPVWALGAMSGTSLDGVDAAMVLTDGEEIIDFGTTAYREYSEQERGVLRAALGRWDQTGAAARVVEDAHAELLAKFQGAEIIGFHGQTLAHEPAGRGTHQAGNGALLAQVLGLPVVWDFRTSDIRLGGQGAPLAPFFHFACAKKIGAVAPIAMLNLGGVGNVSWIDPSCAAPTDARAILAFDTGPANAPLDDLVRARLGLALDRGGELAAAGRVDRTLVEAFLQTAFFHKLPPKSLDRGDFTSLEQSVSNLSDADAAATLTAAAVASVQKGCEHFPAPPSRILVCGGGRHNPVMMAMLREALACPVDAVEAVGLDGDMLEAQAFAYLAVRVARGMATSCPGTTGVSAAVGGGQISQPKRTDL